MFFVGAKNFSPLPIIHNLTRPTGTSKTIGSIVRGFKTGVTKWFRDHTEIQIVWQRNYYDHIIRDDDARLKIAEYIVNNPLNWQKDEDFVGFNSR